MERIRNVYVVDEDTDTRECMSANLDRWLWWVSRAWAPGDRCGGCGLHPPPPLISLSSIDSGTDWVDPHDPTIIAETELLSAAKSIEAAAKKLAQLQPRRQAATPKVRVVVC